MGIDVLTFWPISGLGDIIVTTPLSPIFKYPLISNHSFGISISMANASATFGLQEFNQLNPSTSPPLARLLFLIKARLPNFVLI